MASTKVAHTTESWSASRSRRQVHMPQSVLVSSNMVFDMDVDDEQVPAQRRSNHYCDLSAISQRLAYFARPQGEFAQRLLQDVRAYKSVVQREECQVDAVVLATKLSNVGYRVYVRTALGGGDACFKNLRHEFLVVRGEGDFEQYEYIVEPQLREHFEIPHPSSTYLEILKLVPQEFVGTVSSLSQVVQTLCTEMAASFTAQALTLPPWRRVDSMLSKWMPAKSKDLALGGIASQQENTRSCSSLHTSSSRSQSHFSSAVPCKLSSSGVVVKPPSVPGMLPVYSVQFGFAPRTAV